MLCLNSKLERTTLCLHVTLWDTDYFTITGADTSLQDMVCPAQYAGRDVIGSYSIHSEIFLLCCASRSSECLLHVLPLLVEAKFRHLISTHLRCIDPTRFCGMLWTYGTMIGCYLWLSSGTTTFNNVCHSSGWLQTNMWCRLDITGENMTYRGPREH